MNEYGYKTVSIKFLPELTHKLLHILKEKEGKQFWEVIVEALHQYVLNHEKLENERIEFNYSEELPK